MALNFSAEALPIFTALLNLATSLSLIMLPKQFSIPLTLQQSIFSQMSSNVLLYFFYIFYKIFFKYYIFT